jgi:hypothetical protein
MPALPPVPGTIRVMLTQKDANDLDVVTRMYLAYTGPAPTGAQLVTLAGATSTGWLTAWATSCIAAVGLNRVDIVDLASLTGAVGADLTTHVGSRAGIPLTGATCALINKKVARRYRGGKPRSYIPFGVAADLTDAQHWTAGALTAWKTSYDGLITAIRAAPWAGATLTGEVNVSYYSGFASVQNPVTHRWKNLSTPRLAPIVDPIISTAANPVPGNQRRRNRFG